MKLRWKIWFEQDGEAVFGPGRAALLRAVDREGSIQAAARSLGMSYRHAWSMLRASAERCGRELVRTRRGGKAGGGAELTHYGRALLEAHQRLADRFDQALKEASDEVPLPGD